MAPSEAARVSSGGDAGGSHDAAHGGAACSLTANIEVGQDIIFCRTLSIITCKIKNATTGYTSSSQDYSSMFNVTVFVLRAENKADALANLI